MKIYNVFLLILVTSFASLVSFAQSGTISGSVVTSDRQPVEAVSVGIKGKHLGAVTDANGQYRISKIKPGNYILYISAVGLTPQEKPVTIAGGSVLKVNFVLTENAKELQEVIISGGNKYKATSVSSSLRIDQPLLEVPQNIQVVTGNLLKDQQIFDMLEGVTRNVSGVSRTEHWDNYARITMRGANIAAFRNGMNVTMPWGPLTEDMSIVDRIEFVKGPAGFMLASGEPSGFYNVVTKKPTGITKGEANLILGSFDTYRAALDLDGKLNDNGKLLYRFNVMGELKGSHRQYDYNNRYTLAPVLTYKIDDKTSITAEYTYQFSQMPALGSAYLFSTEGYATAPRNLSLLEPNMEPTRISDHSLFLTLNHKINDNWKLTSQLAYLTFTQRGSSMWPSAIYDDDFNVLESGVYANGDIRRSVNLFDAWGQNKLGQAYVNGKLSTGNITHTILAGLDMGNKQYIGDFGQSYVLNGPGDLFNIYHPVYGQVSPEDILDFDRSKSIRQRAGAGMNYENYTAVYVQDELGFLNNRIRLTLAGRYTTLKQFDGYSAATNDGKFTPRIGISVSLDKQTSMYGLFDQSFIPQSGLIWGGGTIKPLNGNNLELGIKRDWLEGKWNTTLSAYQITKNNVMAADPDPSHTPWGVYSVQVGQVKTKGIEFDLRGQIVPGLNATLNYAYTDSKITENAGDPYAGSSIDAYARHITNGWLSYRLTQNKLKGLGFSLGYQYQIGRVPGDWGGLNLKDRSLPDYFRLDGSIGWQGSRMTISLNINNILNQYLFIGGAYDDYYYWQAEPGTNFRLSAGFNF